MKFENFHDYEILECKQKPCTSPIKGQQEWKKKQVNLLENGMGNRGEYIREKHLDHRAGGQ